MESIKTAILILLAVVVLVMFYVNREQEKLIKSDKELIKLLEEISYQRAKWYHENWEYTNKLINRQDSLIEDLFEIRYNTKKHDDHTR